MMLAMFPSEPAAPVLRIPHVGFMPTGAEVGSAEAPVKGDVLKLFFWSCERMLEQSMREIFECALVYRRGYTMDTTALLYIAA